MNASCGKNLKNRSIEQTPVLTKPRFSIPIYSIICILLKHRECYKIPSYFICRRLSFNTLLNQLSGTLFYCNIKTACCFLPFLHISWSSEEESAWLLELSKITKVGNLPPWFWCRFIWKENGKSFIWKFQRIWNKIQH